MSSNQLTDAVTPPRVLAQDQAQRNEGNRDERDNRNPDIKYQEELSEYKKEKEQYDKDVKEYDKEVALFDKGEHPTQLHAKKLDANWYYIPRFEPKGKESVSVQRERWRTKYASKLAHNENLNKLYGGRPNIGKPSVGILQRTSADILQGKSNVPLKQTSSSVQRQVRNLKLYKSYQTSSMSYNEYRSRKTGIAATVLQKEQAEQARRNWSSAISARSSLVQSRTAYTQQIRNLNKQNRLGQMAATTKQNAKVLSQLSAVGIKPERLKQASGRPQPVTKSDPIQSTKQVDSTDPVAPRTARSIFDIPQSEFAAIQAGRGITEEFKIGSWNKSSEGAFIKKTPSTTIRGKESGSLKTSKVAPMLLLQLQKQALDLQARKDADQNMPSPTWTIGDRQFTSLKAAQKYQLTQEGGNEKFLGVVSMMDLKGDDKILGKTDGGFLGNLYDYVRHSDAVDFGEIERKTLTDDVHYYSAHALKPITDIGLSIANLLGADEKISPTLSSKVIETGIKVGEAMVEQKKLYGVTISDGTNPVGKYVKDDPLRTLVEVPAEVALWVTGAKVIELGVKGARAISPIKYIKPSIAGDPVFRGIGLKTPTGSFKPVLGIQKGKLTRGYDPSKLPTQNIPLKERGGGELALGKGGEKEVFYSERTLGQFEKEGFINPLSKERARATVRLEESVQSDFGKSFKGGVSGSEFKSISEKQGDFLLRKSALLQKAKEVETLHGSVATSVSVEPSLKAQAGNVLKMGDLDVHPIPRRGESFEAAGSRLIKDYATDFPLEKGESLKVIDKAGINKALELTKAGGEKEKIFEVVMKQSDETPLGKASPKDPDRILDFKIPFDKKIKEVNYDLLTHDLNYQGLTQTKTITSFQQYQKTAGTLSGKLDPKVQKIVGLDTEAKASIYPARGRAKDIKRRYWQARQSELNQIRGGDPIVAQETRLRAEKFKDLYPELDFSVGVPDEKVVINLSSRLGTSSSSIKPISVTGITPKGLVSTTPTESDLSKSFKQYEANRVSIPKTSITSSKISKPLSSKTSKPLSSKTSKPLSSSSKLSSVTPKKIYSSSVTPKKTSSSKIGSVKISKPKLPISSSSLAIKKEKGSSKIIPPRKTPSSIWTPTSPSSKGSSTSSSRGVSKPSSKVLRGIGGTATILQPKTKKVGGLFWIDNKNTTKKGKGQPKKGYDFLGNTRLDQIEGLIRRKEVIHGDKRLPKQIKKDKKLGFGQKVRIF